MIACVIGIIVMVKKQKRRRELNRLNHYNKIDNTFPTVQPYFNPTNSTGNQGFNQGYSNQAIVNNQGFSQGGVNRGIPGT